MTQPRWFQSKDGNCFTRNDGATVIRVKTRRMTVAKWRGVYWNNGWQANDPRRNTCTPDAAMTAIDKAYPTKMGL